MLTNSDKKFYNDLEKRLKIEHIEVCTMTDEGYNAKSVYETKYGRLSFAVAEREMLMNYRKLKYIPQVGDCVEAYAYTNKGGKKTMYVEHFVVIGKHFFMDGYEFLQVIVTREENYFNQFSLKIPVRLAKNI